MAISYPAGAGPVNDLCQADRRLFLAGAAALLAMPGRLIAGEGEWPVGAQLWSVFDELERDFDGTLARLAQIGFRRVEAAGWHKRTPEMFRKGMAAAGLVCDSAHVSAADLANDPAGTIGRVRDSGCAFLVVSSPLTARPVASDRNWLAAVMQAMDLDAWKRTADLLQHASDPVAKAGLKLGYHNHVAEFARYDGRRGYDVIVAGTDPALVLLELDVAWAAAGGEDAPALIRRLGRRIMRLHLKDLKSLPPAGRIADDFTTVPAGQGVIDWKAVLAAARQAGIAGSYLELEPPHLRSPFEELDAGRRYIRALLA